MVVGETVQAEADISIESIELVGLEGLKALDEASVISLDDGVTAIGAQPLRDLEADAGGPWSARIPADSAQLKSGTHYSVTVVVELEGTVGQADGMNVTYRTENGEVHSAEGTTSYRLAPSC
ncbi:MAG: hypothetical protein P0Y60_11990 [Candidatus Microbacterium colombiense]|nr:MAG: hypothetical protein P0Y60_11990 [Microbacterium sp.]